MIWDIHNAPPISMPRKLKVHWIVKRYSTFFHCMFALSSLGTGLNIYIDHSIDFHNVEFQTSRQDISIYFSSFQRAKAYLLLHLSIWRPRGMLHLSAPRPELYEYRISWWMVGMIHELVCSELFQQLVKHVSRLSCILTARSLRDVYRFDCCEGLVIRFLMH